MVKFCLQHYIFVKFSNKIPTLITYQFGSYDTIRRGDIFFEIAPTFFDFFLCQNFSSSKNGYHRHGINQCATIAIFH